MKGESEAEMRAWCQSRLAYDDPAAALTFLTSGFGLKEESRVEGPDDTFMAWLAFGNSKLIIGRSGPMHHNLYSPRETGKPTAEVNVVVDDIDTHYARALAAGAAIDTVLADAPWGQRHYSAVDPEGHGWHFMKPLQDIRSGNATREGMELRLAYADERAAMQFLTEAFGFREAARLDNPDGSIMAWLGFGDGHVMIGRADATERRHSPKETEKPTAMVNLHVNDIDAHFAHAVAHGARIVSQLSDTTWGFRRYEALDPEGNRWHVMQEYQA